MDTLGHVFNGKHDAGEGVHGEHNEKGDNHRLLLGVHDGRNKDSQPQGREEVEKREQEQEWDAPLDGYVKDEVAYDEDK